jgi:hypothetical protein
MSDVFLSYSGRSRKHSEALAKELQALGVSVWVDREQIRAGASWEEEISKAIRDARVVAFLVDPHSPAGSSGWVQREYMAALEHSWSDENKVLVPVLVGNAEPPSFLRHASALRVRGQKSGWARAAKSIAKILSEGNSVKHTKAPRREQTQRLNLIEREANALRASEVEQLRKM